MLLPQMLNHFISTTISLSLTLRTSNDRTGMESRLVVMNLILMPNTISVSGEAPSAGGIRACKAGVDDRFDGPGARVWRQWKEC
jgi:hypothetical protein